MIIVKPEKNDSSNIYGICAKNTYILLIFLIFLIDSYYYYWYMNRVDIIENCVTDSRSHNLLEVSDY
jgi:hypothetical protein